MLGTIQNIFKEKGFGFIRGENGLKYYFHASKLKNVKIEDLEIGQEVTFEDAEGSKGMNADDIYV